MKKIEDVKVVVLNYSGNVGKTTLCQTLLLPRIQNASYYKVETINSTGNDDGDQVAAARFNKLIEDISIEDSAVVDVGSSNVEMFISKMLEFKGSHEEIDYFIIPVTPDEKQVRDTLSIYSTLIGHGVDKDSIKIIINRVEKDWRDPGHEIDDLVELDGLGEIITLKGYPLVVYDEEYYGRFFNDPRSHEEIVNDDTDYNQMKKDASDVNERRMYSKANQTRRLAHGAEEVLSRVFHELHLK